MKERKKKRKQLMEDDRRAICREHCSLGNASSSLCALIPYPYRIAGMMHRPASRYLAQETSHFSSSLRKPNERVRTCSPSFIRRRFRIDFVVRLT